MKVFETSNPDKVNFVDGNNVFVGYDLSQQCCEEAGWYISESPQRIEEYPTEYCLDNYYFSLPLDDLSDYEEEVIFSLISKKSLTVLYLHLYNVHNGYYAHDYSCLLDGKPLKEGHI